MREITSTSNPFVKQLRSLATSKKAREESGTFIIEGWRGIETLLTHESRQYKLENIAISDELKKFEELELLVGTAVPAVRGGQGTARPTDIVRLPAHLFDKISDVKNAQGILGVVRHTPAPFEFFPDTGRYLLLDGIGDPGNLGTLVRSAVGAAFDGVLLHGHCVEPFNPKVIRSSMGTFAFCNIHDIPREDLDRMLDTGYELCVTTGHDGDSLYETSFGRKTILAIGSEAHGVSRELMQRATKKVTIPLAKECESLNAAMAGSICMFHIRHGSSCGTSRA